MTYSSRLDRRERAQNRVDYRRVARRHARSPVRWRQRLARRGAEPRARSPAPALRVSSLELPSNPSSTRARFTWWCRSCSAVKPMPPSTCWQCLAAVSAALPAAALASSAVRSGLSVAGQAQRRLGAFDGHQRLGQPVPDRLEGRDRPAELHPVQRVLAGQRQHRPGRTDQPPAQRPAGFGTAASARPRARAAAAAHRASVPLSLFWRSHTTQPPPAYGMRRGAAGLARRSSRSTTSLRTEACEPVSPSSRNTSGIARSGMSESMSAQPSSASAASSSAPEVDSMVLRSASSSKLERCRVQLGSHRHSFPRSSRRRAMMLRCTSAVPP